MKHIFTLMLTALFAFPIAAQSTVNEEFRIVQNLYQKDKKELVRESMNLTEAQGGGFWSVYDSYESQRMNLGTERFKIIKDYAAQYAALTDEQAAALINRVFENDKALVNLKKSYLKKFSKAAGGMNAAKFFQIDAYLDLMVKHETMAAIPFVDEIQKSEKH
jgi:hypothetical protein